MEQLIQLCTSFFGTAPAKTECLAKAGSNRTYVRFFAPEDCDCRTVIGVIGQSKLENDSFIHLARHFFSKGMNVPEVLSVSDDGMRYLQTDLGSTSLYDALKSGRENGGNYDGCQRALIAKTLRQLARLQTIGAKGLDFSRCIPPTEFGFRAVMADLHYFKYCFLKTTELEYDEMRFEEEAEKLAEELAVKNEQTFLYRDFQARNVMLSPEGEPFFIDFQGGRRGAPHYDVASFLWQASAHYSAELRESMVEEYLDELETASPCLDREAFRKRLMLFAFFRTLQVLGAYGYRGYFERKKYFLDSIPPAMENLRTLLAAGIAKSYPHLEETLQRMVGMKRFATDVAERGTASVSRHDGKGPLVVRVFSFSFKKGIPEDTSGNGGGYVFDCRSTHNPGRYEPYKPLTGRDIPVIRFLEEDGEILTFLESVYKLADAHVERYIARGFTDLMFSFGCTGGRHRSVYCAQHLAERLNEKYGIEVKLCHREQGISETFPAK